MQIIKQIFSKKVFQIVLLTMIGVVMLAGAAAAQAPTATIAYLEGAVTVALQGQTPVPATMDLVLSQGDHLQTGAGATVVLVLSDESELQLGENSSVQLSELLLNVQTGARQSRLKLWWGSVKSWLAPGHQTPGSTFEVQTPNALAGVKFSQPISEFSYDPTTQKTTITAYQFDILVTNLLSGATFLLTQGHSAVVFEGLIEQVAAQAAEQTQTPEKPSTTQALEEPQMPPPGSPELSTGGLSKKALITLGVAGAGAAGAAIALVGGSDSGGNDNGTAVTSFSGNFGREQILQAGVTQQVVMRLSQTGNAISGTREETVVLDGCCTATGTGAISGTVAENIASLHVIRGAGHCSCANEKTATADTIARGQFTISDDGSRVVGLSWNQETGSGPATLENNGRVLRYNNEDYARQ